MNTAARLWTPMVHSSCRERLERLSTCGIYPWPLLQKRGSIPIPFLRPRQGEGDLESGSKLPHSKRGLALALAGSLIESAAGSAHSKSLLLLEFRVEETADAVGPDHAAHVLLLESALVVEGGDGL